MECETQLEDLETGSDSLACGWGPLEASLLTCLVSSQDDQSVALLTDYSWPFHGAWLPHGVAALNLASPWRGHLGLVTLLLVECSSGFPGGLVVKNPPAMQEI